MSCLSESDAIWMFKGNRLENSSEMLMFSDKYFHVLYVENLTKNMEGVYECLGWKYGKPNSKLVMLRVIGKFRN